MNKSLAIFGATAGTLCAALLIGAPSLGHWASLGFCSASSGKAATRELQWSGGNSMAIKIGGKVHFKVAPEWRAIAHGPAAALEHLRLRRDSIEFDDSLDFCDADVSIELSGPAVERWLVAGSGDLRLEDLNQRQLEVTIAGSGSAVAGGSVEHTRASVRGSGDINLGALTQQRIEVDIRGSGSVMAEGRAERADIAIFGSGDALLGRLRVGNAAVSIRGSGNVDIAPEESAEVQIFGSGDVRLRTEPRHIETQIHGSGNIHNS